MAEGRFYSRQPATGVKRASAEVRTDGPAPLPLMALQKAHPEAAEALAARADELERELRDAVQLDFAVPDGKLSIRSHGALERTPQAAVKIAVALVEEGVLSREEALLRVLPAHIDRLLLPSFEPAEVRQATRQGRLLATGQGVGEGVVAGTAARDVASAWRLLQAGEPAILVVDELTYREREVLPMLSGAVVRRRGAARLAARHYEWPGVVVEDLPEGDTLSLDAASGQVFEGRLTPVPGALPADAAILLGWADEVRRLQVRANVTSAAGATLAYALGASGVGLFRIESLLHQSHRLPTFQAALRELCHNEPGEAALQWEAQLREDLTELFAAASGPFVLRLLDVPTATNLRYWRDYTHLPGDYFQGPLGLWIDELNPLQGLRGGRLSLVFPALLELQVRAARQAAAGASFRLQLMMPGVCAVEELRALRRVAGEGVEIGSMLELPRACLTAGKLAQEASFLSFGTGDLTETTCGISRYDALLSFLPGYLEAGLLPRDPFEAIDEEGVGALMQIAVQQGRAGRPSLEIGACGRQAAESVTFCHRLGLDYVSVTPGRVPGARLAAARAVLDEEA